MICLYIQSNTWDCDWWGSQYIVPADTTGDALHSAYAPQAQDCFENYNQGSIYLFIYKCILRVHLNRQKQIPNQVIFTMLSKASEKCVIWYWYCSHTIF